MFTLKRVSGLSNEAGNLQHFITFPQDQQITQKQILRIFKYHQTHITYRIQ